MSDEKTERYKFVDAVVTLIELTRKGKLQWAIEKNAKTAFDDERITAVFKTEYNGKHFRIYKIKVERGYDSALAVNLSNSVGGLRYKETVFLDVITEDGEVIWTFPQVYALSNLLDTVEYQASDMATFLENINREANLSAN